MSPVRPHRCRRRTYRSSPVAVAGTLNWTWKSWGDFNLEMLGGNIDVNGWIGTGSNEGGEGCGCGCYYGYGYGYDHSTSTTYLYDTERPPSTTLNHPHQNPNIINKTNIVNTAWLGGPYQGLIGSSLDPFVNPYIPYLPMDSDHGRWIEFKPASNDGDDSPGPQASTSTCTRTPTTTTTTTSNTTSNSLIPTTSSAKRGMGSMRVGIETRRSSRVVPQLGSGLTSRGNPNHNSDGNGDWEIERDWTSEGGKGKEIINIIPLLSSNNRLTGSITSTSTTSSSSESDDSPSSRSTSSSSTSSSDESSSSSWIPPRNGDILRCACCSYAYDDDDDDDDDDD